MWGKPDSKPEWGKGVSTSAPTGSTSAKAAIKKEKLTVQKEWGKNPESEAVVKAVAEEKNIDEDTFRKMKSICLNIVKGREYYSFSNFKPAEYKYFTELVELYQKFLGKAISKEEAEIAEKMLLEQYTQYKELEVRYRNNIEEWNNAIRNSELYCSSICKCDDRDTALDLALQAVTEMTGDTVTMTVARNKYLKDKPMAVTYDVSSTLCKDK